MGHFSMEKSVPDGSTLNGNQQYDQLDAEARGQLGISGDRNKPLVARFIAEALAQAGQVPVFVEDIVTMVRNKLPAAS